MSPVILTELATTLAGSLGMLFTLNDAALSRVGALRWLLAFAALTAACLLGEARLASTATALR